MLLPSLHCTTPASGSRPVTMRSGTHSMPCSTKASRTALEASGEGGIGVAKGITNETVEAARSPRSGPE